jgi:hypothetical protein
MAHHIVMAHLDDADTTPAIEAVEILDERRWKRRSELGRNLKWTEALKLELRSALAAHLQGRQFKPQVKESIAFVRGLLTAKGWHTNAISAISIERKVVRHVHNKLWPKSGST